MRPRGSSGALTAAAALILLSVAVLVVVPTTDRIQLVNPLEWAGANWLLAAALSLPAPGLLGVGWADPRSRRLARWLAGTFSAGIAILVLAWIIPGVAQVDCRPVTTPLAALPASLPVAVMAGLSLGVPAAIAARLAGRGRVAAAMLAGSMGAVVAMGLTAVAFIVVNPPLGCAPPV
ncbi:MAG: hypothetical protein HYX57_05890 [Chloroflexi bacterium]|nr:hypothetical protein [Chloroflexota bacterium]